MGNATGTEPDATGESTRSIAGGAVVETGPGGGAMVYVPLGGVDHASCQDVYTRGKSGQDLSDQADCPVANDISVRVEVS